jgi:hypothetical protein
MNKISVTLFKMAEKEFEILITKRKEHKLSCVEILKDKPHLLASQKIMNPKCMQIPYKPNDMKMLHTIALDI